MFCEEYKSKPLWSSSAAPPPASELFSQLAPPSSAAPPGTSAWKYSGAWTERKRKYSDKSKEKKVYHYFFL